MWAGSGGGQGQPTQGFPPQVEGRAETLSRGTGEPWEALEQGRGRAALEPWDCQTGGRSAGRAGPTGEAAPELGQGTGAGPGESV